MGKSKKNRAAVQRSSGASAEALSFGDTIPVLDRRELIAGLCGVRANGPLV